MLRVSLVLVVLLLAVATDSYRHNNKHHKTTEKLKPKQHKTKFTDLEQQAEDNNNNNNSNNNNNEDEAVLLAKAEAEAEKAAIQMEDLESSVQRMRSEINELKSDLNQAEAEMGTAKVQSAIQPAATATETDSNNNDKDNNNDNNNDSPQAAVDQMVEKNIKESSKVESSEQQKPDAAAEEKKDLEEAEDLESLDDYAFLQTTDPMNDSVDDDDSSAPVNIVSRMSKNPRTIVLAQSQQDDDEEVGPFKPEKEPETTVNGRLIPVSSDGTLNVDEEIPTKPDAPAPTYSEEMTIANVAEGDPTKETPSNPTRTDIKPDARASTSDSGSTNATVEEKDVVCVCKRQQQAPRGFDRVRCKRHPSPSPTPTPLPPAGVKQCVKGAWTKGKEKGTTDTICVYFPHTAPPAEQEEPKEPEYPPECYDGRNEWVAEGVQQRIKFHAADRHNMHQVLLQGEFEACGCED